MKVKEFQKGLRFSTYEMGYGTVQLRDNKIEEKGAVRGQSRGIVAVFPTIGGQYCTTQVYRQSVRLARRLCRMLNKSSVN